MDYAMNSMTSLAETPPNHICNKKRKHSNDGGFDSTLQKPESSRKNEPPKNLRYWLVDMINSDEIPGLRWENNERTIFRIPWKHAGKNNWREEDCKIFKAWAQYRGKYKEGDKVEAAIWKTRLRCALNKLSDIQELKDRSNLEGSDPYRVYQLLPESSKNESLMYPGSSPSQIGPEVKRSPRSPSSLFKIDTMKTEMFFRRSSDSNLSVRAPSMSQQHSIYNNQLQIVPPPGYAAPSPNLPGSHSPSSFFTGPYPNQPMHCDVTNTFQNQREKAITVNNEYRGGINPINEPETNLSLTPPVLAPEPHEMEIYIKYRGVTVTARHVIEPSGCRIYYGDASLQFIAAANHKLPNNVFGLESLDQIRLVECEAFASSEKQVMLTKNVLRRITRGLLLFYDKHKLCFYAKKLCESGVFISGPESEKNDPEKLERNTAVKVFDYTKFCDKLRKFVPDGLTKLPTTELHASFAQNWSITTPIDRNLVTLCMIPRAAKFMIHKMREKHNVDSFTDNPLQENFSYNSIDVLVEHALLESSRCVDDLIQDISFEDSFFHMPPTGPYEPAPTQSNICSPSSGYFQRNVIQPIIPPPTEGMQVTSLY